MSLITRRSKGTKLTIDELDSNLEYLEALAGSASNSSTSYSHSEYTKAGNSKITGLNLHPSLKKKISEGGYPGGFDMGIDKGGYFIHTHRARSKSYEDPSRISVKEIKFIDSTG